MKKTSNFRQGFVLTLCLLGAAVLPALAQTPAPVPPTPVVPNRVTSPAPPAQSGDVSIKIIETTDANEAVELNRTYHIDGMNSDQRDALVNKLVDSLRAKRNGRPARQLTIIVEDSRDTNRVSRKLRKIRPNAAPNGYAYGWGPGWPQNFQQDLNIQIDSLGQQMKRFQFQLPSDFGAKMARPFEAWAREANTKPASIRGLDAYPNNPDRNQLNIRFMAPTTGDVLIMVTNPKGKEVARKELNNFTGEFVGQIDLGKKATGTFFVTVTQNEDGAVKRIVVE